MLKQIRKRNLYEDVIKEIQHLISDGTYSKGTKLPGERELAGELGVNRATVREALRIMEMMRMVEKRPGEGVFVKDLRQEASIESIVFEFLAEDGLKPDILNDLYEAILHVESIMARLAAERRNDKEIAKLEKTFFKMENALDNRYKFALADKEFHLLLGQIAKSEVLLKFSHTIWIILEKYAHLLYEKKENRLTSLEQHTELFKAVKKGQTALAYKKNWEHYLWAKGMIIE